MWYRLFGVLIFQFRTENLCNHMWERRLSCIVALSAGASFSWYVLDPILQSLHTSHLCVGTIGYTHGACSWDPELLK